MAKVVSLFQPYAQLVVMGVKLIETRTWATKYRGEILIHASQGFHRGLMRLVGEHPFRNYIKLMAHELPTGKIIGKVNLVDVQTTEKLKAIGLTPDERAFGDYTDGRFGWLLKDAVMFEKPIPAKGMLGIWNYDLKEMTAFSKATADKEVANG
jgi:hypothetical protein